MSPKPRHFLVAGAVAVGLSAGAFGIAAAANRQAEAPSTTPPTTTPPSTPAPQPGSTTGDEAAEKQEKKQQKEQQKEQEQAQLASQAKVSEQQAKDAAVAAVGGGTVKKAELEKDGNVVVWEVAVTKADNAEVEVKIDANIAAVLSQEVEGQDDPAEQQKEADEQAELAAEAKVNEQQAKDAAARAAGGNATKAGLEKKKGTLVWEVDVTKPDNTRVEVKIDATTGAVIDQKQESGDDD